MVGGQQATFYREQASEYYGANVVEKVWSQAKGLGFEQFFVNEKGGAITDDHIFVNQITGIPTIDIIQYDPKSGSVLSSRVAITWLVVSVTVVNTPPTPPSSLRIGLCDQL